VEQEIIRAGIVPYSWRANDNPYQKLLADSLEGAGVSVARLECRRLFPIGEIRRADLDVVHMDWAHKFYGGRNRLFAWLKTASFHRRVKSLGRRKLVWTIHNMYRHGVADLGRREFAVRRWIVSQCAAIMALSEHSAALIREVYALPDDLPVYVIPHGHYIDVYPNEVSREEARRRLGLDRARRCVLFLGLLRRYKGVDLLIEAFSRVGEDGDVLVIVGRPSDDCDVAGLDRMAESMCPKGCRILFQPGEVEDKDIQLYFNASDVVALPFRRVLNSGTLLLAMSFGRCVVVPRLGSIPEIACPSGYFGYDAEDPNGLAEALRRALGHPELLERGRRCLEFVRRRYAWPGIGRRVRRLYEEVLGRA